MSSTSIGATTINLSKAKAKAKAKPMAKAMVMGAVKYSATVWSRGFAPTKTLKAEAPTKSLKGDARMKYHYSRLRSRQKPYSTLANHPCSVLCGS